MACAAGEGYGRLHTQQSHTTQARDYLTRALEIFERLGTLGEPEKVRQALAHLQKLKPWGELSTEPTVGTTVTPMGALGAVRVLLYRKIPGE